MTREIAFPNWWWGPFGATAEPRSIASYIADGMIDVGLGAWLWLAIEAGASTIVCAGPSGAGKSTLLTSFLSFLNSERQPYFVRGRYERFEAFDQSSSPKPALLINEISAHLPIYLWGPALAQAHRISRSGAQLMATAHAQGPDELIDQLEAFPNNLTHADLATWDLVIFVDAWMEGRTVRREIRAINSFTAGTENDLTISRLAHRDRRRAPLEIDDSRFRELAIRLEIDGARVSNEIANRSALLRGNDSGSAS